MGLSFIGLGRDQGSLIEKQPDKRALLFNFLKEKISDSSLELDDVIDYQAVQIFFEVLKGYLDHERYQDFNVFYQALQEELIKGDFPEPLVKLTKQLIGQWFSLNKMTEPVLLDLNSDTSNQKILPSVKLADFDPERLRAFELIDSPEKFLKAMNNLPLDFSKVKNSRAELRELIKFIQTNQGRWPLGKLIDETEKLLLAGEFGNGPVKDEALRLINEKTRFVTEADLELANLEQKLAGILEIGDGDLKRGIYDLMRLIAASKRSGYSGREILRLIKDDVASLGFLPEALRVKIWPHLQIRQ